MDIFLHYYKIRTRWLTWLLYVELVVSDSKEPDKKIKDIARVKHSKHTCIANCARDRETTTLTFCFFLFAT